MGRLTIVLGPTAVGKTSYSIGLAKSLSCPIVNCDSRQIFKEMRIGTARPSDEELAQVRHYFIASHSIFDNYTAGRFEIEALALLEELFKNYSDVVMTGGSGLYIDALCNGLDDFPEADTRLRETLMRRLREEGIESLRFELRRLDPASFGFIDPSNGQRIVRALEVTLSTGKPYSAWRTAPAKRRPFGIRKIGLSRPREEVYARIDARVDKMMSDGLLDEVRSLLPWRDLPALNTVGYRELFGYIDGRYPLEEAVRLIKRNTRHYAKKQLTWWGRDSSIEWVSI